jgi:hypothetical protein
MLNVSVSINFKLNVELIKRFEDYDDFYYGCYEIDNGVYLAGLACLIREGAAIA